jgi:signal transduction histidine kinase
VTRDPEEVIAALRRWLGPPEFPKGPTARPRVFGLFEKLEEHGEGSGIGLALVRRIVNAHGGRVWLESDGPGAGSTFFFSLPIVQSGRLD